MVTWNIESNDSNNQRTNTKATRNTRNNPGDGRFDIPRTLNTVERSALHEMLSGFESQRLILVTAPPGYGKTTVIAQFIDKYNIPVAWHTIEDRDRDLPNLQLHSLRALRSIVPGIDQVTEPFASPREFATHITSYVRDSVDEHFLYVLDDLHLIVGSAQAESWLQALVELLPPMCHLVLISRTLPDLPLAELIAKRAIIAIGQNHLRFTPHEASTLAHNLGSTISPDVIDQRVRQLEGWPAGVVMALQPLPDEIELSMSNGAQGPEALFYTLAGLMLQKQSPVLRDFLLASSVLARLTPELCSTVLDITNSQSALSLTASRGLFVTQVTGGLTYHRLFRSFLQMQLKRLYPDRFVILHTRAAEWFNDHGDIDSAFEHYMAAEKIDEALAIIERAHMAYFNQGKVETLLGWRSMLGEYAERVPYLIYKCAIIYTDRYMYDDAEAELEIAERMFTRMGDSVGLADVRIQYILIIMRHGEYAAAARNLELLLADTTLPERIIARAKHMLAVSYMALGETETALLLLSEVVPIYERSQDLLAMSNALHDMEVAYTQQGDMENASRCLQRVVSLCRRMQRPDALALALNNLGYHYHQRRNYEEGIRALDEGLQIISQTNNRRAESYLLWSLGDIRRDLGEFEVALQLYEHAYELSSGMEPTLQRSITLSMSTLYRWKGEMLLAENLAREVVAQGSSLDTPDDLLALSKQWITAAHWSDPRRAFDELVRLLARLEKYKTRLEYKLCALFCAQAALLAGYQNVVEPYLVECLSTNPDIQNQCPPELIAEIAYTPILHDYVWTKTRYRTIQEAVHKLEAQRFRRSSRTLTKAPALLSDQTYSLKVRTLGSEGIERNGVAVPPSAWRASRAREFFLYLLLEGPQTRDHLSLMFWPDSSAKRVRSNFHTTLYRMRQPLGENAIIFENERYGVNPEIEIFCDALAFADCLRQARLLPSADVHAEDLYQRAIQLYQGDFLPSLDTEWVNSYRHHYAEMAIEALVGGGHCARARRDYKEAVSLFRRALSLDPYREEIYRAIFLCYGELGESYQVIAQLREMEQLFKRELGIGVSTETMTLAKSLI